VPHTDCVSEIHSVTEKHYYFIKMTKFFLKILTYLLINPPSKSTNLNLENLLKQGYEIIDFQDKNTTVSNYDG